MGEFIISYRQLTLILGYYVLVSIMWRYFIPDNRDTTKDYKELAKTIFIMYALFFFLPFYL